MLSTVYKCDTCGKLKGKTNHWFMLSELALATEFYLIPFNEDVNKAGRSFKDFCSEQCVKEELSRWLAARQFESVQKTEEYNDYKKI